MLAYRRIVEMEDISDMAVDVDVFINAVVVSPFKLR
jgi:hypothetical protein